MTFHAFHRLAPRGRAARVALVAAGIATLAGVGLEMDTRARHAGMMLDERRAAGEEVERVVQEVGEALGSLVPLGLDLAARLEAGRLSPRSLVAGMETLLTDNPQVYEVGIAAEPFAVDPRNKAFSPSFDRKYGEIRHSPQSTYDYQDPANPDAEWYVSALHADGPLWQEPYCDGLSCYVEYAVPFDTPRASPGGVVYINMHPRDLSKLIESSGLGAAGYAIVVSRQGLLVSHPQTSWVYEGRTLAEIAEEGEDEALVELTPKVLAGESGVLQHVDPNNDQKSWIFYRPIPGTDFSMLAVYIFDHIESRTKARFYGRYLSARLLALVAVFFLGLFMAIHFYEELGVRCLWGFSALASVLFLLAIALVWRAVLSGARQDGGMLDGVSTRLVQRHTVRALLGDYRSLAQAAGEQEPIPLETGVFIQSIEFEDSYNVFATGYVWQRVSAVEHAHIEPGFRLPEAVSPTIELEYRQPLEDEDGKVNGELLGWYFEALLRQSFDYSKYPFDDKSVWIRLWPKDPVSPVVLTPLFDSYSQIKPTLLPGIEKDFVLPGWSLQQSYFAFRNNTYNVNFGLDRRNRPESLPELYFHIDIRRNFMNAFISNLVPLISVVLILYTLLLIVTYDGIRSERHGFSTAEILGSAAALFFSVLIGHMQLRDQFQVEEVMYLEYFFFVVYVMILGVSLNALLFSAGENDGSWVRRHDNLYMKLSYWPLILGALCAITLWTFA